MQVGEEDPFAHLVAVEKEIRGVVEVVPLHFSVVRCGELHGIGVADVVARRIRLLNVGVGLMRGSTGVPVITIERNAEREL